MSVQSVVADGRAAAEARMLDTCTISTPGGLPVWNDTTEQYDTTTTVVYTGPCRVKLTAAMSIEPDAGDRATVVVRPSLHIPADVEGVQVGSAVVIDAAELNPSLVGVLLRVTSLFRDSQATAQRLECTEVQL